MRIIFLSGVAIMAACSAFAGLDVVPVVPDVVDPSSSSDATGAVVLLALVGVVIATGMIGKTTRNNNNFDAAPTDADDDVGF